MMTKLSNLIKVFVEEFLDMAELSALGSITQGWVPELYVLAHTVHTQYLTDFVRHVQMR